MFKNIVFDVGGVFVIWEPRAVFSKYFNSPDEVEYFMKEIDFYELNELGDRGVSVSKQLKEKAEQFPQYKQALMAYDRDWIDSIVSDIDGSYEMAMQLKKNGYKIYILSNWEKDKFRIMDKQKKFIENFDGYIISADLGFAKPDRRIYDAFLNKYHLKSEECVFFDDRKENTDAAKIAGFESFVFTTSAKAKQDLRSLNIKI